MLILIPDSEGADMLTTVPLDLDGLEVPLRVDDSGGAGRPVLLLHGGGGVRTVAAFGERLAADGWRAVVPALPGFDGTPRPDGLDGPGDLGALAVALLEALDLDNVLVVGNSLGGWVAAEVAILGSPRIAGVVLVDAAGAVVAGHPPLDFFAMTLPEVADHSYFEPDRFRIDVSALPPAARQAFAGNAAALRHYGGPSTTDPTLLARLAGVRVPLLVVWGEADRMIPPQVGRAVAAAAPGARFELLERTGHLPQLETPERFEAALRRFADETARPASA